MLVSDLLRGDWLQYSGGSRPGVTGIRFLGTDDGEVHLQLFYVFDANTNEAEEFSFELSRTEFEQLARDLVGAGSAVLERNDGFRFEWRRSPRGFEFKIRGRGADPFSGSRVIDFAEFREVPCGELHE